MRIEKINWKGTRIILLFCQHHMIKDIWVISSIVWEKINLSVGPKSQWYLSVSKNWELLLLLLKDW